MGISQMGADKTMQRGQRPAGGFNQMLVLCAGGSYGHQHGQHTQLDRWLSVCRKSLKLALTSTQELLQTCTATKASSSKPEGRLQGATAARLLFNRSISCFTYSQICGYPRLGIFGEPPLTLGLSWKRPGHDSEAGLFFG